MKFGTPLSAGRISVRGVSDLLVWVDNRVSVAVRRAVVLERERMSPRGSQHQRRRENQDDSQGLHVIRSF